MPLLTHHAFLSSPLPPPRTRSNTDPRPPKPSHPSLSIASKYPNGWGTIHFCSQGPFSPRRTSIFTDQHLSCEGHPVIFEYGDDIKVFHIGEAKIANFGERMGRSRMVFVGKEEEKEEKGKWREGRWKNGNGNGIASSGRESQIFGRGFQKGTPIRKGRMVKDERGCVRAVYQDEEVIELGRRIARESIRDVSMLLKIPLMPIKNSMEGDAEYSVRTLWSWGFGN